MSFMGAYEVCCLCLEQWSWDW